MKKLGLVTPQFRASPERCSQCVVSIAGGSPNWLIYHWFPCAPAEVHGHGNGRFLSLGSRTSSREKRQIFAPSIIVRTINELGSGCLALLSWGFDYIYPLIRLDLACRLWESKEA